MTTCVTREPAAKMTTMQKIKEIEDEMARTQKNKATSGHLGMLKVKCKLISIHADTFISLLFSFSAPQAVCSRLNSPSQILSFCKLSNYYHKHVDLEFASIGPLNLFVISLLQNRRWVGHMQAYPLCGSN